MRYFRSCDRTNAMYKSVNRFKIHFLCFGRGTYDKEYTTWNVENVWLRHAILVVRIIINATTCCMYSTGLW